MSEQQATQIARTNGMATASLILGLIAFLLAVTVMPLAPVPSILAIVFGFMGNSRAKQVGGIGHASSLWGVLLGFAPLLISILLMSIGAAGSLP